MTDYRFAIYAIRKHLGDVMDNECELRILELWKMCDELIGMEEEECQECWRKKNEMRL